MKMLRLGRWGLLRRALARVRLAARLLREPQVPVALKALLIGAGCYVLLPFDIVPDFLPGLGQLDDLTATLLAIEGVIALVPPRLVDHHLAGIRTRRPFAPAPGREPDGTVIDAEWRRH